MDIIRALLLKLEARYKGVGGVLFHFEDEDLAVDGVDGYSITYHLGLLVDAGLVSGQVKADYGYAHNGMTWAGHDFLDSIRDEEIWRKTKEGVGLAGGFTMDLIKALARGYLKTKVEKLTGIDLML